MKLLAYFRRWCHQIVRPLGNHCSCNEYVDRKLSWIGCTCGRTFYGAMRGDWGKEVLGVFDK